MDERIGPVDPGHDELIFHEEALNRKFPKYVKIFFCFYDLQCMFPCCNDGALNNPDGRSSSTKLIYLSHLVLNC